ncbi:hypothetical protein DX927_13890 [Bacillus swezeyi]|uniref:Uncharacterized protein n=1 Tax=Bacillus swezeyi TaxID=1925020 RepID=A0A5M8RT48_9BACI|nr:hypothetical protein DX927_13890 [Bacillus swezeyi]
MDKHLRKFVTWTRMKMNRRLKKGMKMFFSPCLSDSRMILQKAFDLKSVEKPRYKAFLQRDPSHESFLPPLTSVFHAGLSAESLIFRIEMKS